MDETAKRRSNLRAQVLGGLLALAACGLAAPAAAAIPASERQVLLDLYAGTNGEGWTQNAGWGGPEGGECAWYGVGCDEAGEHVTSLTLAANHLVGQLPASLNGLGNLESLDVGSNQLDGEIPSLQGLAHLAQFRAGYNQLSGAIPPLQGLVNLQYFSVSSNQLSGAIPSLQGLTHLTSFFVGFNQLSGEIPPLLGLTNLDAFSAGFNQLSGAIPSLQGLSNLRSFVASFNRLNGTIPSLQGLSNLRSFVASFNRLNGTIPPLQELTNLVSFAVGSNRLHGEIPPLQGLTRLQSFSAFDNQLSGQIPSLQGLVALQSITLSFNQLSGAIPSLQGLPSLLTFLVDSNQLSGAIPSLAEQTNLSRFDVSWNQLSGEVPQVPQSANLTSWIETGELTERSALCPNALTRTENSGWDTATGETPWYQTCVAPGAQVDLNQRGLAGSWAFTAADAQGFVLDVFPDMIEPGTALLFASWFTYDTAGAQRWYTLEGHADRADQGAALDVYGYRGGSFDSKQPVERVQVGSARLLASDCTYASIAYRFDDGRSGTIPLTRLLTNAGCASTGDSGAGGRQLLSGAWADVASNTNQGFLFDVDPILNVFFAAWYTFLPESPADAGFDGQHWYTLNAVPATAEFHSIEDIGIYDSNGGHFLQHIVPPSSPEQVGSASIHFHGCASATLEYQFVSGPNAGRVGTLNLRYLGAPHSDCGL